MAQVISKTLQGDLGNDERVGIETRIRLENDVVPDVSVQKFFLSFSDTAHHFYVRGALSCQGAETYSRSGIHR